jgi:CRP-like cAMP-binding protein
MNIRTNLASARRETVAHGYPSPVVTTLARGQALLHAGQYGALWRVVSGAFRVERQGDGAHALIQLALPGDCIGLESLFGQPCTVTVSALVASTAHIEPVPDEATRLALVAQALVQQQRQAQDMARLRIGAAADRVAWLVRCVGGDVADPATRKALPPLKEMAQIIDVAPETICRQLRRRMPSLKPPRPRTDALGARPGSPARV